MECRAVVFVYIFVAIIQGLIWGFIAQIISENKGYEDGFSGFFPWDYRAYRCCLQTG